jgi:hypothetical protein
MTGQRSDVRSGQLVFADGQKIATLRFQAPVPVTNIQVRLYFQGRVVYSKQVTPIAG